MFHISMLRSYTLDPAHVVDWGEIEVDTDETFEEGLVCIMDSRDQFCDARREASESIVAIPWSGGYNLGSVRTRCGPPIPSCLGMKVCILVV